MAATPPWKIAIVTGADPTGADAGEDAYKEIKNSLLYGDHTHWIALEAAGSWNRELEEALIKMMREWDEESVRKLDSKWVKPQPVTKSRWSRYPLSFRPFVDALNSGGAGQAITLHTIGPLMEKLEVQLPMPKGAPGHDEAMNLAIQNSIAAKVDECQVFIGEGWFDVPAQNWNSYIAADALMRGMSRLLLRDVSSLPIDGIMELRHKLKDSLDPMRAEMLGLTEDLRKIVGSSRDPNLLTAEVENLIATRVERVIRDADRRANELLQKKWRKLLAGAAKAFGFAGAGFLDQKLLGKAVQQTLETGALALSPADDHGVSMSETSQFVLRARRLTDRLRDKGND
jgi:hypothetical protein